MVLFSKEWFKEYQKQLLWLLNTPILSIWFRYVLRINGKRSSVKSRKILRIEPNAITWLEKWVDEDPHFSTEFRGHNKFAKRLYYAFYPLWATLHAWDMLIANRYVPKWNLGFDTLTVFPNASPESTSVDGYVTNGGTIAGGWAAVRDAATGSAASDNAATLFLEAINNGSTYSIRRLFSTFDTSSLGASAEVSDGVCSYNGNVLTSSGVHTIRLVPSTQASNTAVITQDFNDAGTTAYATDKSSSAYVDEDYNDFTLNATGLAAVSKTGITKFALRNVTHDIDNSAPGTSTTYQWSFDSADAAGTSTDPKLTLTFTLPSGAGAMLLMGVG